MRAKPITRATRPVRSCKMAPKSPPPAPAASASMMANSDVVVKKSSDDESTPCDGDRSVLRSSIDTSISNLAQLAKLFENGTSELCDLLTNECSIIYECKVCRNLFRSLANFVSHKRTYCLAKYVEEMEQIMLNRKGATIDTRTTSRQDIISMLDGIIEQSQPRHHHHHRHRHNRHHDARLANHNTVVLREMNSTSAGLINCNKENCFENCATLGPDGRIVEGNGAREGEGDSGSGREGSGNSGGDDGGSGGGGGSGDEASGGGTSPPVACSVCRKRFATRRSLAEHSRAAHADCRMCYVCPCCKKYFTNTWCVHRHLYKDHRKSSEQVRKLRTQIKRKQVTPSELLRSRTNPPAKSLDEKPYDQDKAWMEELEGNTELQRCLGCGKRFDRRVALISHSQTCQRGGVTSSGVGQQAAARPGTKRPRHQRQPSPPSPPAAAGPADEPQEPRSGRIQVRMYYDKGHQVVDQQQQQQAAVVVNTVAQPPSSDTEARSPSPQQQPTITTNDFLKPDKDVTDVVSRYRRDIDVHDKCRRLEAKLLQLHRVAVEEIEGHLTEPVPQTQSSIQEVIGTVETPSETAPPASLVSTTSEIEDERGEDKMEQEEEEEVRIAISSELPQGAAENGSITSCTDIIVIDDDDGDDGEYVMTEANVTYINGTNETDVTSTITIVPTQENNDDKTRRYDVCCGDDTAAGWDDARRRVADCCPSGRRSCGRVEDIGRPSTQLRWSEVQRQDTVQMTNGCSEREGEGSWSGDGPQPPESGGEKSSDGTSEEYEEEATANGSSDRSISESEADMEEDEEEQQEEEVEVEEEEEEEEMDDEEEEREGNATGATDDDQLRAAILEVILGRGGGTEADPMDDATGQGLGHSDFTLPLIDFDELEGEASDSFESDD